MQHSLDSPPLDALECLRVYRIQHNLGAINVCTLCGETKPVFAFSMYGAKACIECQTLEDDAREQWWARMKQRVGITAA